MAQRTYQTEGVVLKTKEIGEADRLVTIFTRRLGKLTAIAKGVRRINSRRSGSLEPATQAIFFFSRGHTWDILTQVQLINSFPATRHNLSRITQTYQILEIIYLLTPEHQEHQDIYELLVDTLTCLSQPGRKRELLVNHIRHLVTLLGFGTPPDPSEAALKAHIESIIDRSLRTKPILG